MTSVPLLVSQELPREVSEFACLEGIYVTRRASAGYGTD